MTPADVTNTMTREEMVIFLESWGFRCDDHDSAEELAEAVAHNCIFEGIDLQQLLRLRNALTVTLRK